MLIARIRIVRSLMLSPPIQKRIKQPYKLAPLSLAKYDRLQQIQDSITPLLCQPKTKATVSRAVAFLLYQVFYNGGDMLQLGIVQLLHILQNIPELIRSLCFGIEKLLRCDVEVFADIEESL